MPDKDDSNSKKATEAAEKLAQKENVDLSQVEGSGKDGSVTKNDVAELVAESNVEVDVEVSEAVTVRLNPKMRNYKKAVVEVLGEYREFTGGETLTGEEWESASQARTGPTYEYPNGVQILLKGGGV